VAVTTADIIGSTKYAPRDRARINKELRRAFEAVGAAYPKAVHTRVAFRITAGDEFQWAIRTAQHAFEMLVFLRSLVSSLDIEPKVSFRASIGVGAMTVTGGSSSYEKDGPAFARSRQGLVQLSRTRGPRSRWTAVVTGDPETDRTVNVVLTFLDALQQQWTRSQWKAIRWALTGMNRTQIAAKLNVAHQSVSKRLIAAQWDQFRVGANFIGHVLQERAQAYSRHK
jgi:hypothetical protein